MIRLVPILVVTAFLSGCAARKPAPAVTPAPPLVDVAPLIQRGCYRCFEEAFAVASRQNQHEQAFEAAVLLALRSKELGMPFAEWMQQAAARAGADPSRQEMLQMAAVISSDALSGDREAAMANPALRIGARKMVTAWQAALRASNASPDFRAYLEATIVCDLASVEQRDAHLKALGEVSTPLMRYRAATCGYPEGERLQPLVDAGLVDAEYPLARYELDVARDAERALGHLQTIAAEFPRSLSAPTMMGNVYLAWEEWQRAVEAFDRVLAVQPGHPDALIGRTQGVSRLLRHQDGIDTATRLITAGNWFVGQAYYWRAWNYNALKNYQAARVEADRTKTLMANANVFLLSGLIDWGLENRPGAETEFQEALKMDFGQCEAAFYLGGVRAEMRRAPEGIAALKQALQCYDLAIAVRRKLIDTIAAGTASETSKTRQIASQQRAIAANEERKTQATRLIDQLETYITSLEGRQSPPATSPSRPAQR